MRRRRGEIRPRKRCRTEGIFWFVFGSPYPTTRVLVVAHLLFIYYSCTSRAVCAWLGGLPQDSGGRLIVTGVNVLTSVACGLIKTTCEGSGGSGHLAGTPHRDDDFLVAHNLITCLFAFRRNTKALMVNVRQVHPTAS